MIKNRFLGGLLVMKHIIFHHPDINNPPKTTKREEEATLKPFIKNYNNDITRKMNEQYF